VVGSREASGYISLVGQHAGEELNASYCRALEVPRLNRAEVAQVLVDLKRRIEGDFYVVEESEERILLGNRACPFGDRVIGRPALCMMTSNVFGVIASESLGYAKVSLEETIADGHDGCRVAVYLKPNATSEQVDGREYFRQEV